MAWDDEQCPNRGPGLNHTTGGTPYCKDCGVALQNRPNGKAGFVVQLAPGRRKQAVPRYLWAEHTEQVQRGMPPADAESLIALRHGLGPGEDQKEPWTLRELAHLEFLRETRSRWHETDGDPEWSVPQPPPTIVAEASPQPHIG